LIGLVGFPTPVPSALAESIPKKGNILSHAGVGKFRREKCPHLELAKDIVHVVADTGGTILGFTAARPSSELRDLDTSRHL